jgi:hypothetical protein
MGVANIIRVLPTPFKPRHFNPTSRINSAVQTPWFSPRLNFASFASRYSSSNESGEFIVNVAAA